MQRIQCFLRERISGCISGNLIEPFVCGLVRRKQPLSMETFWLVRYMLILLCDVFSCQGITSDVLSKGYQLQAPPRSLVFDNISQHVGRILG